MTGFRHGHRPRGGPPTPTYSSWRSMRIRVANKPEYSEVEIDPRWDSFSNFIFDMGERPDGATLDRIDGRLGYTKSNCRWASPTAQSRNKVKQCGVVWAKQQEKWKTHIGMGGKSIHLGYFADWWDAMCARKSAENKYWRSA